jgi:hypothetical protein
VIDTFDYDCRCYARGVQGLEPIKREWYGGTLWAYYEPCEAHAGGQFITPEWTQRIGRLEAGTASCELAATEGHGYGTN